eukprot:8507667-Pyramimonas_sp.AAC.1
MANSRPLRRLTARLGTGDGRRRLPRLHSLCCLPTATLVGGGQLIGIVLPLRTTQLTEVRVQPTEPPLVPRSGSVGNVRKGHEEASQLTDADCA